MEIAAQAGRVARAGLLAPKVIAEGSLLDFQQQSPRGHADLAVGFIRLDWTLFEGGRKIAAARVADSKLREAVAHAESISDQIAFQVNQAYRGAVTSWVGIEDARPAVDQAQENYRLVQLRAREGAATSTEVTDGLAALTRAEQNYLNARYNYLIARDRLDYAMGVARTPGDRSSPPILDAPRPTHPERPPMSTTQTTTVAAPAPPAGRRPRLGRLVAVVLLIAAGDRGGAGGGGLGRLPPDSLDHRRRLRRGAHRQRRAAVGLRADRPIPRRRE